jgi:hypothetical protein
MTDYAASHGGPIGDLAAAVANVMADVPYVLQTGRNDHQRYSYASDADLIGALQPAMARHGLALMVTGVEVLEAANIGKTKSGGERIRHDIRVTYTLVHSSGAWIRVQSAGSGVDHEDKGVYKALTGAYKYALRQTFSIPTGDDAERAEALAPPPPPHKSWERDRAGFCAWARTYAPDLAKPYEAIAEWCVSVGRPRPSRMDQATRSKLRAYLDTEAGAEALLAWTRANPELAPTKPTEVSDA